MDEQTINALLRQLEHIRKRKQMYMADTLPPVVNFLHGFHAACHVLGILDVHDQAYQQVLRERGWRDTATGFEDQLREHGLDEEALADELLTIEIEAWKKHLHSHPTHNYPARHTYTQSGILSLLCIRYPEGHAVLRLLIAVLAAALVGCTGAAATPPPPAPLDLVTEAAVNIRQTETFRMLVERTGAPYFIETDLGNVVFRRATAQYVAPNVMEATVRLIAASLPTEVGVFSRGEKQWYRNDILTGGRWFNAPFSPGFNPQTLIAEETGFQASLRALIDMAYAGDETLEDGSPVHHLTATANGPDVTALLAGLIYMNGVVDVDVYIHRETRLPVRFVITQPDTITETEPDPTRWTIDIYDVNAAPEINDPELAPDVLVPEAATPEVVIIEGVTPEADATEAATPEAVG